MEIEGQRTMSSSPRVYLLRTITTIRPQYFSGAFAAQIDYVDDLLNERASSVDIGALFWNRAFRRHDLLGALELDPEPDAIRHEFGLAAIAALDEARAILGKSAIRLPKAAEMLFCYRVILECA